MRMRMETDSPRARFIGGTIFSLVGAGALAGAIYFGRTQLEIINSWPVVQAEVTRSEVTTGRDSDGDTMYGAFVEFRFHHNGRDYTASADRGWRTSSRGSMRGVVEKFAPGTRHPIHLNPNDPEDIRFNAGYSLEFFGVPLFMSGFGLIFLIIGIAILRKRDAPYAVAQQRGGCPTCHHVSAESPKFCPKCGTMLHED